MKKNVNRPIVTLLTDFGTADHYVSAMKGVMLAICPDLHLVDISHEITAFAIPEAAWTLAHAWHCFPEGTVHLVVVDPGVGSSRRPIVVEAGGHRFVAPDNGVLGLAMEGMPEYTVREIVATEYFRSPVSQTFHGRDIFAPVAAHLSNGVRPSALGNLIGDWKRLEALQPQRVSPVEWIGVVLKADRFGNLITNFAQDVWQDRLASGFNLLIGSHAIARMGSNYSEVTPGELFMIWGSAGTLEISMNGDSAASRTGARPGTALKLRISS